MKRSHGLKVILLGILVGFMYTSCSSDQVLPREKCQDDVTYEEIRFLLNRKCATSGCHDGSSGYGDFRSYQGMVPDIKNGGIESEVLLKGTMPQNDTLSNMEFHLIQCWIDNGYLKE
ncbi:hypothetical protein KUV50_06130 [Membranicola marinus]|uniref:Cytochrome C Planctomycete-type domain-containing protein n=1 Tax=Membranihabitans marinus TaxID=1227546 RepID=A0A953HNB5_9BACT|nr:hypothetical protein [Membranihabitans marinus]MBY5957698.1 hypothetical protein [Membranihabitans marinus]